MPGGPGRAVAALQGCALPRAGGGAGAARGDSPGPGRRRALTPRTGWKLGAMPERHLGGAEAAAVPGFQRLPSPALPRLRRLA